MTYKLFCYFDRIVVPLTVNISKQISDISLDKNYAHPQTNVEGRNKQHTHEHHDLCCSKYNYKFLSVH